MHRVQHGQTTAAGVSAGSELFRNEYAQSAVKCLTLVDPMSSQNAVASPVKALPPRLRFSGVAKEGKRTGRRGIDEWLMIWDRKRAHVPNREGARTELL